MKSEGPGPRGRSKDSKARFTSVSCIYIAGHAESNISVRRQSPFLCNDLLPFKASIYHSIS